MLLLDFTCDSPEENLALDEALLEQAERGDRPREVLRLWEPRQPMVVVGRSSRLAVEVNETACRQRGIPIFRRSSGGAAIVTGPGCLMYAVVLSYQRRPELRALDAAHCFVLQTLCSALAPLAPDVRCQGTSDLTIGGRKVSGNSARCRREHLLYHGTLLYDFSLDLITTCLGTPPRQPAYRAGREHDTFVTNLPVDGQTLRTAIIRAWQADEAFGPLPRDILRDLIAEKYSRSEWNHKC